MKDKTHPDPDVRSRLRVLQYQHVDGTFELTFGGLFLLVAVCIYLQAILPPSPFSNLWPIVFLLVYIGGGFLLERLVRPIRERITYPRTGYLAYRRQPRPLRRATRLAIWIGVPLLTVTLLALLFLNRSKFPSQSQDSVLYLMPGLGGFLFGGIWALVGWKIALRRYYLIAAVSLLLGMGLLFSGLGGYLGTTWFFGGMGLLLLASGGVTLWRYLRQNPASQEAFDEH